MKNNTNQELDLITRIRGEVMNRKEHTGVNLFLLWGYPTVFVFMAEFVALKVWRIYLCEWLWVFIPLVGVPLMVYFLRKDYERTGHRTLEANLALQMWMFIGGASCLSGFTTDIAGVYESCYCLLQGLLIGMGSFLTGVISRFPPMRVCGLAGALLSFGCLAFQGEQWPWQLLITAIVTIVALIIPGHLSRQTVKRNR
jgi:hypothetical protein